MVRRLVDGCRYCSRPRPVYLAKPCYEKQSKAKQCKVITHTAAGFLPTLLSMISLCPVEVENKCQSVCVEELLW